MSKATLLKSTIAPPGLKFLQFIVKFKTQPAPYDTIPEYHLVLMGSDSLRTACGTTILRSQAKNVKMKLYDAEPGKPMYCCPSCLRNQKTLFGGTVSKSPLPSKPEKHGSDDYFGRDQQEGLFKKPEPKKIEPKKKKLFS